MKSLLSLALLFFPLTAWSAIPPTNAEMQYKEIKNKLLNPGFEQGKIGWEDPGTKASVVIEDITYTAVQQGSAGNSIQIVYVDNVAEGPALPTVSVAGSVITVEVNDLGAAPLSTADEIAAAINADDLANDIVVAVVTGTGTNIQSLQGPTNLAGGGVQGTRAIVTSPASNVGEGRQSLSWDASAATQSIRTSLTSMSSSAKNCAGMFRYKGGDSNLTAQVIDSNGNVLNSIALEAQTNWTPVELTFPCASARIDIVASANAAVIYLDSAFLGEALLLNLGQAELAGSAYYNTVANCSWTRTNTALGAFSADTDCQAPIIESQYLGSWQTTDADLPQWTINNLPRGRYEVIVTGTAVGGASESVLAFTISDGTTTSGRGSGTSPTGAGMGSEFTIVGIFDYAQAGNRTFAVHGSANTGSVNIGNDTGNLRLGITVKRFPDATEVFARPETVAWVVDANISGTNPSLGSSNVSSYTEITSAGLTLTQNTGSIGAQIACASSEESSGTTCTGNESLGVSFNLPVAGEVEACASFGHYVDVRTTSGAEVNATFQVVETLNNGQTILKEGKTRLPSRLQAPTTAVAQQSNPMHVCGTFFFTSSGKKTIRLMYEQTTVATVSSNEVLTDAAAANGQRDLHWVIRPKSQNSPAPLQVNGVVSPSSGIDKVTRATLECDASAQILSQGGSWISSIANKSGNCCVLTLPVSMFSSGPTCQITPRGTFNISYLDTDPTATSISVCATDAAGASVSQFFAHLNCQGPR